MGDDARGGADTVSASNGYPTIRGAVMGPIVRALDAAGAPCDALLAEFGLSRRQLSDPYEILPLGRYIGAFERAAQVLGESFLGLRLGREIPVSELGPAGFLFVSSPTLGAAIGRFSEALASWQSAAIVDLAGNHGWPMWRYRIAHPGIWPRRQDAEYSVSSMCHMIRLVRGAQWKPVEVHFEHAAPDEIKPLMRVFQAPVRFQQPVSGVVMCAQDLDAPLKSVDVSLARLMERHATDLIERDAMPKNLVDQVRDLVTRRLAREKLVVTDIARDLGLSNRSLQRHLAMANTSVREIIREERQRSVATLHEREGMNNAAIARAVGYADATVLWRAKRNWTRRG
ncbi:AraC family transcriptional regulator [Burkholderia glumae]|uniref:AraC family transcriptional regulator n=1 Tax=Burkholderia glumae TaxID=337 RepID=A0AAP9XZ53_BURGL|nr:AraC family transcriptional regulator [Burkholderia glumae]ACR30599.1 Transcriptional regulator, AraC family [Burkholderia glumae BGR1]KHJ62348.1 AraC family transcriptional regulator [Burkholderia glumae]MCM2484111.1 AraC family transcriptional regulator [Burkholderia glumae]MCM2494453.1 AraC family transcriptional regulator [Burkholderia glumae]MCM2509801.1 AraC family transcriptional regulator [Burkholderia glumae]